jgi:hypothetical protein
MCTWFSYRQLQLNSLKLPQVHYQNASSLQVAEMIYQLEDQVQRHLV